MVFQVLLPVNINHEIIESGLIPVKIDAIPDTTVYNTQPITHLLVSPNPFKTTTFPNQFEITNQIPSLVKYSQNGGTLITFDAHSYFKENKSIVKTGKMSVSIGIFDPLGNTVINISPQYLLLESLDTNQFGIYWNGTNLNNRRVEKGMYKIILQWEINNKRGALSSLIGVKE